MIAANNVVPEVGDGRNDVVDDYVAEPSFSVGKSPPQNGVAAFEKISGAGGLGEGTPKVSPLSLNFFLCILKTLASIYQTKKKKKKNYNNNNKKLASICSLSFISDLFLT